MDPTSTASNMSDYDGELRVYTEDGEVVFEVDGAVVFRTNWESARSISIQTLRCANSLRHP